MQNSIIPSVNLLLDLKKLQQHQQNKKKTKQKIISCYARIDRDREVEIARENVYNFLA